jgi:hypothetical protein
MPCRRSGQPKMSIGCPETSVMNYHYALHNIPEERRSYLLRGGSLKSRRNFIVYCIMFVLWHVVHHCNVNDLCKVS